MITKQFTLYLENKPGVLASVTNKLADARVNLEGISVAESTDVAIVQIVVDSAMKTQRVLNKIGIPFSMQNVALVHLENKPGALAKIATKLAKSGIHINYIYATGCTCNHGCKSFVVISSSNLRKVEQTWKAISK